MLPLSVDVSDIVSIQIVVPSESGQILSMPVHQFVAKVKV